MIYVFFPSKESNVENQTLSDPNFKLWLLFTSIHHKMVALRELELNPYNITTSQLRLLRIIESLGSKSILTEVAKTVERKIDVISRQAAMLEKDGLITRITKPKSRALRLELTEKGKELLRTIHGSQGLNEVLSVLSEKEREQMSLALKKILTKLNKYSVEEH
jgi:DNA-binding MarR family transcriptional regulator